LPCCSYLTTISVAGALEDANDLAGPSAGVGRVHPRRDGVTVHRAVHVARRDVDVAAVEGHEAVASLRHADAADDRVAILQADELVLAGREDLPGMHESSQGGLNLGGVGAGQSRFGGHVGSSGAPSRGEAH
jgi:hypothetical protein